MPTFCILGATGNTGKSILTLLLDDPAAQIRCFVRSAKKLHGQTPDLHNNKRVRIFESSLADIPTLAECLLDCDAAFSCIATEENSPDCSIALDTAHSVIAALSYIRIVMKKTTPLPRIIVLSSGTINDKLTREQPWLARKFVGMSFYYIYADLKRSEEYYRLHEDWMTAIFVQPGGLVHDVQSGHVVSTEREEHRSFLGFLDLAAGMIECGSKSRDDMEWDWVNLSVVPTGNTRFNYKAPLLAFRGLTWTVLPPLYWTCRSAGLV